MPDPAEHLPDDAELQAPEALRGDLAALFGADVPVPPEVDEAVVASARRHFARRRRPLAVLRWAAVAAAAAAVFLAVYLGGDRERPATKATRSPRPPKAPAAFEKAAVAKAQAAVKEDIDRNGRVDILDAFMLARYLETDRRPRGEWDVTGDGVVDKSDVHTVAMAAVSLDRGAYR